MSAEKTMRPIQPAVRCFRRGKKNERLKSAGEKFLFVEKSEEYSAGLSKRAHPTGDG
jgi:hypothetical protein